MLQGQMLTGDKFTSEMQLREPRFTYNACEPLLKIKKENKNLKKQEIQRIFMMAYGDFKDLP